MALALAQAQAAQRVGEVPVGAVVVHQGRVVASQGTVLDRRGRVHLNQDDAGQVWVGGDSVTCISGTVVMVIDVMAREAKPPQP